MLNKQSSYRGFGFYALLVVVVVIVWLMLDAREDASGAYTMAAFEQALEDGEIAFVEIEQNREIPTGTLNIQLTDGNDKKLYVSDVNEIQNLLDRKSVV